MFAYALLIAFISVFVVITVVGHVLLLTAVYPTLFGNPGDTADNVLADALPERVASPAAMQPDSKLAA